jgi:hypothetical protein
MNPLSITLATIDAIVWANAAIQIVALVGLFV